ncbi:hypothetical protein KUCAC02_031382 [Chaenocephalus aceratus]|nr:hypothetical protein KUCAC02_031382 [Chaenocephalus aceratus]
MAPVLLLVLLGLVQLGSAQPVDLKKLQAALQDLQVERREMSLRLDMAERELKRVKETPKVAFAASLGGNGLVKATSGNKNLVYTALLTNVGGAYNANTGEFTAPIRGVYYIRFTANAPSNFPMSAVLYKNDNQIQLIAHEQPGGEGSDTASNGAALMLEAGDRLKMVLWTNTQIWDNSNHHSTFSGFLLFSMVDEPPKEFDAEAEMKTLEVSLMQLQAENRGILERLNSTESELKTMRDVPKVAFSVSLGGNGLVKTTSGRKNSHLQRRHDKTSDRRTTLRPVSSRRRSVDRGGEGSDTASNGAALMLEAGDRLKMVLWTNTQIWDNSNHHSTFSGFLLFPQRAP